MKFLSLYILLFSAMVFAQAPEKHPRVSEVEEKLRDEASRYFTRRFPGEAFFVRVDVNPLRRISKESMKGESLPYFDTVSEEDVDEWDDPTTPISFLRHRVTKVSLELSVPESFTEEKVSSIKNELQIYLKLLPFRDEIRIERNLKANEVPLVPPYFYSISAFVLVSLLLFGVILKFSIGGKKEAASVVSSVRPQETPAPLTTREPSRSNSSGRNSTDVRGDVTFHDPLKIMDIINVKMGLIEKSGTFPTLRDMMTIDASHAISSVVHAFPSTIQMELFSLSSGNRWLEAFADPQPVNHETLLTLDRLARERSFTSSDRNWENLLIQIWRLGDRSASFFKKLNQDEAFYILQQLPKTVSLVIAKKAFPGAWGRILDKNEIKVNLSSEISRVWLKELQLLLPLSEWKTLISFRKDRELLSYLDQATIDEEKEIYESLDDTSFVFQVRPPFYKVFELEKDEFLQLVSRFPVERWALAVVNSSRTYVKQVAEALDDKKKIVFSNQLRALDHRIDLSDQQKCRRKIAEEIAVYVKTDFKVSEQVETVTHAKTA